ncbi:MAG: alpha/beta hydrolase, partial [Gammaproteobacteria bacterium]
TFYTFLFINYALFHVDYRFWFMGVRIFQPEMLAVLLMYLPLFLIFFFSNSLRVNGAMRFKDQPEWLSMLIAGFANSLGLMLIIIIQYSVYFNTGTVFWTTNWLSVNLLFGIVPMMFILPYFNRIFFNMTGRIYLGPLITCLIFIMILSTNTVVYLPID